MKHLFTLFSVLVYGNPNTLCSPVNLQHIYVNGAATGNNSGSSWPHAFTRLQDAIAIAEAGDTIWVAEGTYKPTDDTDREKRFLLKNGVVLLGGFNGTECTTVERDPTLYETILSGDIGVSGDSTDNSFHVLFTIGTDSTTVLDGFTITGGQAIHPDGNAYSGHLDKGGGLYVGTIATLPYASPRIRNCRFIHNTGKNGGAIYCDGTFDDRSADPIFESCTFEYNQATSAGGAIHKKGLSHPDRAFTVRNCRFGYNRSAREGGAIYLFDAGNFSVFSNTHFYHNFAISSGGAVYYETPFESSLMRMDDCSFTDNIGRSGGGITMTITGYYPNGTAVHKVELYRAVFERNQGLNSTGGAVDIYNFSGNRCSVILSHTSFIENYSVFEGGGIHFENSSNCIGTMKIDHCYFAGNQSPAGAAACIYFRGLQDGSLMPIKSTLTVKNSLFSDNDGTIGVVNGSLGTADAQVQNCTFYRNGGFPIAKNWSHNFDDSTYYNRMEVFNSIFWEPGTPMGRIFYNGTLANSTLHAYNLHHNLISAPDCNLPGGDVACGEGNIFATWPAFVDTLNNDFHVMACSPALNAGTNEDVETTATDLDDTPRILDGIVDMGAYERRAYIDSIALVPPSCHGGNDGSVVFHLTGTPPYVYKWVAGGDVAGEGTENLFAENYQFNITDALGCSDMISIQLPQPLPLEADFTVSNASAANIADGSILLEEVTGGTAPYVFLWNTGDTTASLSGLLPGIYSLLLTDAHDCTHLLQFEVSFINATGNPTNTWQLQCSPNPILRGKSLRISQSGDERTELLLTLFNSQGQQAGQLVLKETESYLSTEALAAGVYWLRWQRADGVSGVYKVLVL